MSQTDKSMSLVVALVASLVFSGCAADAIRTGAVTKHYRHAKTQRTVARKEQPAPVETGSVSKTASGPITSKDDPRWHWCEQRHIDYQAGKAPGGASELAQKQEDDRLCAAVYQQAN